MLITASKAVSAVLRIFSEIVKSAITQPRTFGIRIRTIEMKEHLIFCYFFGILLFKPLIGTRGRSLSKNNSNAYQQNFTLFLTLRLSLTNSDHLAIQS